MSQELPFNQVIDILKHFKSEEIELLSRHLDKLRQEKTQECSKETSPKEVFVPENFPPMVKELLKKKGWSWPPDEKLLAQIREAGRKLSGSWKTAPEILKEIHKDLPGR